MPGFNETFGGSVIYPSQTTYLSLILTGDVTLNWPIEQQIGGSDIVADILDLSASAPGRSVIMPDATQATTGFTSLFNNVGAETVTVKDSSGGTIISLVSGTAWQIYLTDNSTEAGVWRTFQYGASVSVSNAAALAGAGLKAITTTLNEKMDINSRSADYIILENDRAKVVQWTSGAGAFTLPDPTVVGSDWFTAILNSGSGDLVVTPAAGLIDGTTSKTFASTNSAWVVTDGTNYYTLGFGSGGGSSGTSFAYITINVAGSGNYTLAGAELNKVSYKFTGVLTGNRNIIVPTAVQEYWVNNATTGAFSLTVKTAAGTGITVTQGSSAILYCDGTNVVIAQSTGTSFPITVGQGGTGATAAGAARTNLGSTAVGDALFTALNAGAALSTVGGASAALTLTAGSGLSGGGDLSANRSFALDINGLTNDPTPDVAADYVATYDASAAGNKKILLNTLAASPGTNNLGYLNIPQNSNSANYTLVIGDAGKHILHPSGAGAGDTFTIPSNASVAFQIGTVVTFINEDSNSVSIAITTDTLVLANSTTTGTRTLAQNGVATAIKITSTKWIINGAGLS